MPILNKPISRAEYYARQYDKRKNKYKVSGDVSGTVEVPQSVENGGYTALVKNDEGKIVGSYDTSTKEIRSQNNIYHSPIDIHSYTDTVRLENIRSVQSNIQPTPSRTQKFIQKVRNVSDVAMNNKYNPLMYVKRGAQTTLNIGGSLVGRGLVTSLQYSKKLQNKPAYTVEQESAILNYGRKATNFMSSNTISYGVGGVFGGITASYLKVKAIVGSKSLSYTLAGVTGWSLGWGYGHSENKGEFLLYAGSNLYSGISGFKGGYKMYDPVNPNINYGRLSQSKTYYVESNTRNKYNRLIDTDLGLVSSKRVGMVESVKEVSPYGVKLVQSISGKRVSGKRSIFAFNDGNYGVIDRYSVNKIFGGKNEIFREMTPIESTRSGEIAIDYEVSLFNGKNIPKTISGGVATFNINDITYSNKIITEAIIKNVDLAISRADKYSFSESIAKINTQYPSGRVVSNQKVFQRVSLGTPYVRSIVKEPAFIVNSKGSYIGYNERVVGHRVIGVFGNELYVDSLKVSGGSISEVKYPNQLSESFIKNDIKIVGNPLNTLEGSKSKFYPGTSYYYRDRPNTFSRMLSNKRGILVYPEINEVKPISIKIPMRKASINTQFINFNNVYTPNINIKSMRMGLPSISLGSTNEPIQSYNTKNMIIPIYRDNIINRNDYRMDLQPSLEFRQHNRIIQSTRQNLLQQQMIQQSYPMEVRQNKIITPRIPRFIIKPPIVPTMPRFAFPKSTNIKRGRSFSIPKLSFSRKDIFAIPDLLSVSQTEAKNYALKGYGEAIAPRLTRRVKVATYKAFRGQGLGRIPTLQQQIKKYGGKNVL